MKRLLVLLLLIPLFLVGRFTIASPYARGEELFNSHCAACHGPEAGGSDKGPPLVHDIYHPGHHVDASFHIAVRIGVRAHHWGFGNMPPVKGLGWEEVELIIRYVRELQREAGIF